MNLIVVSSLTCDEGLFFRHISMMGKTEMGYDVLVESKKEEIRTNNESPSAEWMYEEHHKLSSTMKFRILHRDGFKCKKCGKTREDDVLEVDHIHPVSKWGRSIEANLETLCRGCNCGKSNFILN